MIYLEKTALSLYSVLCKTPLVLTIDFNPYANDLIKATADTKLAADACVIQAHITDFTKGTTSTLLQKLMPTLPDEVRKVVVQHCFITAPSSDMFRVVVTRVFNMHVHMTSEALLLSSNGIVFMCRAWDGTTSGLCNLSAEIQRQAAFDPEIDSFSAQCTSLCLNNEAFDRRLDAAAIRALIRDSEAEITIEELSFIIVRQEAMRAQYRQGTEAVIAAADLARANLAQAYAVQQAQAAQAKAGALAVQADSRSITGHWRQPSWYQLLE
jgi:hypothetical protein